MNQGYSECEVKRLNSGFWKHDFCFYTNEHVWSCDLSILERAVKCILIDPNESILFAENREKYLDTRFGYGTSYAYFNKHKGKSVELRTSAEHKMGTLLRRQGVPAAYSGLGTSTNTSIFTGTSTSSFGSIINPSSCSKITKPKPVTYRRKNMPFEVHGNSLMEQLQVEFDSWAGKIRSEIYE